MSIEALKNRFKNFAISVATVIQEIPQSTVNRVYSNQLVRSSSSSGANYHAASRAKSSADFINKLKIVEEELDESIFFLELIQHFNPNLEEQFTTNLKEGKELLAITIKSIKTARTNQKTK